MKKYIVSIVIGLALFVAAHVAVNAQSPTTAPSATPAPSIVVPSGAPATGRGI